MFNLCFTSALMQHHSFFRNQYPLVGTLFYTVGGGGGGGKSGGGFWTGLMPLGLFLFIYLFICLFIYLFMVHMNMCTIF